MTRFFPCSIHSHLESSSMMCNIQLPLWIIKRFIQICSGIFQGCFFDKTIQFLEIAQIPFSIHDTLYFFSEWKKFYIGICKHFLQYFCHTGEPHTFKLTADFIVLCGKLVFIYHRYSSFPRKLLCSGSEDVVGTE